MNVNDSVSTEEVCGEEARGHKEEERRVLVCIPQPAPSTRAERQPVDTHARLDLSHDLPRGPNAQDIDLETSGLQRPHFLSNARIGGVPGIRYVANGHRWNRRESRGQPFTPTTTILRARNAQGPSAKRRSARWSAPSKRTRKAPGIQP